MKKYFILATAALALAACSKNGFDGDPENLKPVEKTAEIVFGSTTNPLTRADITGASAADILGGNFIVEGTKGTEAADAPSSSVVFDNFLVCYQANTAGTTESNTHNWEYVGMEAGSTLVPAATWTALHAGATDAKMQSIKYWDYTEAQYDFIAYSTGASKAVATTPGAGEVQVTRIATGATLSSAAYTFVAPSVDELKNVYYTDITTVLPAAYGNVVTLKFKNLTAKIRLGIYENVPGYSVSDVEFYTNDADYINTDVSGNPATLFSDNALAAGIPTSGTVAVMYPHIGTTHRDATPQQTTDYNKAAVTVTAGSTKTSTMGFGALYNFASPERYEATGNYIGRDLPAATMAGDNTKAYYQNVIPNNAGQTLTLRVNYTLTSIDGSGEKIHIYGAKAVVPATYTKWQPNYAYTYIFKISDNTNGWTSNAVDGSGVPTTPEGLFPITFDAVVASYTDANAEQTSLTTVATPSITTYQQGHKHTASNEYSKTTGKNIYVQVMNNSTVPATLVGTLSAANSLLYAVDKATATEAEVMDALVNRTNDKDAVNPVGRNGVTLTKDATNISNTITSIVNGVDDNPISVTAGQAAEIKISALAPGTYAYVYVPTAATADEAIYQCVTPADAAATANYYEVATSSLVAATSATAVAGKVYFVKNVDALGNLVNYTFKQTKVGDDVTGLFEGTISAKGDGSNLNATSFYFDVFNQNNGEYAVKVIKIVA